MIHERYNELLRKLELPYRPVAIKMCFEKPEVPRYDGPACAFCQFVKYVQDTGKSFYMQVEDDQCYGKLAMGMIDKPPVTASGQAGKDFGCFQTQMPNRELYRKFLFWSRARLTMWYSLRRIPVISCRICCSSPPICPRRIS